MTWLRRQDRASGPDESAEPDETRSDTAVLIDSDDVPPVDRSAPAEAPEAALPAAGQVPLPAAGQVPLPAAGQDGDAVASAQDDRDARWSPADPADLEAERRQLIDLLIYAWDRARSPGVWERLTAGLAEVGVSVLQPDGEPFDPNAHEVGGTEHTDDASKIDTVAETEVAGFADRGRLIREPVVVVYRSRPSTG